jgi:hypothetical protein
VKQKIMSVSEGLSKILTRQSIAALEMHDGIQVDDFSRESQETSVLTGPIAVLETIVLFDNSTPPMC